MKPALVSSFIERHPHDTQNGDKSGSHPDSAKASYIRLLFAMLCEWENGAQ